MFEEKQIQCKFLSLVKTRIRVSKNFLLIYLLKAPFLPKQQCVEAQLFRVLSIVYVTFVIYCIYAVSLFSCEI